MEILNVIEQGVDWFLVLLSVILLVFALIVLSLMALAIKEEDYLPALVMFLFSAVIGALAVTGFDSEFSEKPPHYEVKITDFNEVYEKGYEIIDKRGEIYVIKESEAE